MRSASVSTSANKTISTGRYVSLRLAAFWILFAVAAAAFALLRQRGVFAYITLLIAGYALYAFVNVSLGIKVHEDGLSVPRPLLPQLPILPARRIWVPYAEIAEMTSVGSWMAHECVILSAQDRRVPLLFSTPEKRRALLNEVHALSPETRIYRAV